MEEIGEVVQKGYKKLKALENNLWLDISLILAFLFFKFLELIITRGGYKFLIPKVDENIIYYSLASGFFPKVALYLVAFFACTGFAMFLTDKLFYLLHYVEAWEYYFRYRDSRKFRLLKPSLSFAIIWFIIWMIPCYFVLKSSEVVITQNKVYSDGIVVYESNVQEIKNIKNMDLQVRSTGNIVKVVYHMIKEKSFNIHHATFDHKINGQSIDGAIISKDKGDVIKIFNDIADRSKSKVNYIYYIDYMDINKEKDMDSDEIKNKKVKKIEHLSREQWRDMINKFPCKSCKPLMEKESI